jgi:hypothetical protein
MIAKGVDGNATYFRVFSRGIVFRNKRLHLAAHCLVNRALARNSSESSGFCPATRFFDRAAVVRTDSTQLGSAFTSG